MVDGSVFNNPNTCFFPIFFHNKDHSSQSMDKEVNTIYLGQHFMSDEIIIYDNSPYVEDNEYYAQIGLGIEIPKWKQEVETAYQSKEVSLEKLYQPEGVLIDSYNNLADSSVFTPNLDMEEYSPTA